MDKKKAYEFFKQNKRYLKQNQRTTIKGQIKAGDIAGAIKGIERIKSIRLAEMGKVSVANG